MLASSDIMVDVRCPKTVCPRKHCFLIMKGKGTPFLEVNIDVLEV